MMLPQRLAGFRIKPGNHNQGQIRLTDLLPYFIVA